MRILIIISIAILGVKYSYSQSAEEYFKIGQQYLVFENEDGAVKCFLRVKFLQPGSELAFRANEALADFYIDKNQYSKAAIYLQQNVPLAPDDSTKNQILLKLASVELHNHQFNSALEELFSITHPEAPENSKDYTLLLATAYYGLGNYEKAQKLFIELAPEQQKVIEEQFIFLRKWNDKSERKAKYLSLLLPGLGQAVSGNYKASANSILLLSAITTGFLLIYTHYGILEASISTLPWFQRYYIGGAEKARILMKEKKEKVKYNTFNKVISVVSK